MEEVKATILLLLAIGLLYGAMQKKHKKMTTHIPYKAVKKFKH